MSVTSQAFGCVALMLLALKWCEGNLQCFCSTRDCQENRDILCNTDSLCYVQYTPPGPDVDPDIPQVVRGCIDGRTPLLCENQRPGVYSGSWPILYCCDRDLCNKDAIPTLPPWASEREESKPRQNRSRPGHAADKREKQQTISRRHPDSDLVDTFVKLPKNTKNSNSSFINPLYVGVPVAGACVLLAIIIFAIYILRKQHQMYEEHFQRTEPVKRPRPSCQDGCRYITMPTANGQYFARCQNGCIYTECDRSSNGSESRLLAQV